jgi:hypothetical protein
MQISRETWGVVGVATVCLAIVAVLGLGVWEQVAQLRQIYDAEVELSPLLAREKERNAELLIELKRVSSPEYPEEFGRVYGELLGEGEVRVVSSLPEVSVESAESASPSAGTPESFWAFLWRCLLGGGD